MNGYSQMVNQNPTDIPSTIIVNPVDSGTEVFEKRDCSNVTVSGPENSTIYDGENSSRTIRYQWDERLKAKLKKHNNKNKGAFGKSAVTRKKKQ